MPLDQDELQRRVEEDDRRDHSVVPIHEHRRTSGGQSSGDPELDELLERVPQATPEEAARLCRINYADLKQTLSRHAPLYAYVASNYYHARRRRAAAEREVDRVRARVFNDIQDEEPDLAANKTERRVEDHPDVNAAEQKVLEAREREDRLHGILQGMRERGSMLNHVAAIQRREQETYR